MSRKLPTHVLLVAAVTLLQVTLPAQEKQKAMAQRPSSAATSKSITLHQEVDFSASPKRVYEALLDANQFSALSSMPAEIDRKVGGAFSLFGAHIVGRIVELVPDQRIVEAWRPVDWTAGVYSIARFELKPHGTGTRLVFDHTGFPEGQHDHLMEGWKTNYWDNLTKYLK
jgi:activator of HSP90 ATPase